MSVSSPDRDEQVIGRGRGAPPAPLQPDAGTCPRCGALYEPGQEYCLDCGLRLPLRRGVVGALETRWRRRLRWYPGDWLWPALLFLALAAAGATAAVLYARSDEPVQRTIVATMPPGAPPATTATPETGPAETAPPATATADQPPAAAPEPPPPPPPPAAPIEWPAGKVGYTIVLRSIPVEDGRSRATAEAQRAIDAGVADVGVLESSDYASLHPRYYVVFSGVYDSEDDAEGALGDVHGKGYEEAYTRYVAP